MHITLANCLPFFKMGGEDPLEQSHNVREVIALTALLSELAEVVGEKFFR